MTILKIQDLNFSSSYTLHEAILSSAENAIYGAGAFAFVSKSALRLTIEDSIFSNLLQNGQFEFVAGVDQITNETTLNYLSELMDQHSTLKVCVFDHDDRNVLFHPKFCWFKKLDGSGVLIVGSGNFTIGGLRRNREAFGIIELNNSQLLSVEEQWNQWIEESLSYLKLPSDNNVIEKARRNRIQSQLRRGRERGLETVETVETVEAVAPEVTSIDTDEENDEWTFSITNQVLIAEIPRSGSRWKQANFDIDTFQNFFGAIPGDNSQRILFRSVDSAHVLGEVEVRQSVSVISQNYRFELDAASDLAYPVTGRPIGFFVKLSPRMFLYYLSMPNYPNHNLIETALNRISSSRNNQVKRGRAVVNDVLSEISQIPLGNFLQN